MMFGLGMIPLLLSVALAWLEIAFLRRQLRRARAELRCALDKREPGEGRELIAPEHLRHRLERLPPNTLLLTGEGGTVREVHPPFAAPAGVSPTVYARSPDQQDPDKRPPRPKPTSIPGPGRTVLG